MKIRIRGNSVRYRLTQSEVKQLSQTGKLSEATCFGANTLWYNLEAKEGIETLQASLEGSTITMYMPIQDAREWYDIDRIGYENTVALTPETGLFLLVEKDFACLDHTNEDQSDNYPNPNKTC